MFSIIYFPLASALALPSLPNGLWDILREGHVSSFAYQMSRIAESLDDELHAASWWQLRADLQVALGCHANAEESYRTSQKMIRTGKHDVHVASTRNTGWQAFFRYRFATAMACFSRLTDEHGIDPRRRLEAMFGVMCVQFQLGNLRASEHALQMMLSTLETSIAEIESTDDWFEIVHTLQADIAVQRALRSRPQLSDHVYWRSEISRELGLSNGTDVGDGRLLTALLATVKSPILRSRIHYLTALHKLAGGEHKAMNDLTAHLRWATVNGLVPYQKFAREEIALASIAGGAPHIAEIVLSALSAENRHAPDHGQLEYLYCLAKTRQAEGRHYDAMLLYSRYALSAMQCLRESSRAVSYLYRTGQREEVLDDVAARLPAKYRRAYRYILENLERSDLSVKEIAIEIGVTIRALQNVFKSCLGATPRDVIRQRRMERIRAELQGEEKHSEEGVQQAASRWGVRHRSSLAMDYKNQYNEVPSETLKRSGR
ncbi:helix-turn-helix transcriptional regulator [Trinickia mobilis]|uniref:helix-turn-helix transcriptional regulator n=1 Tax=Trinickia mobilis TaxID=2816356 RepID=UPI001A8F7FCC|nr:helix-turn-helix transcriptional regulator [Trinickia mobilis]